MQVLSGKNRGDIFFQGGPKFLRDILQCGEAKFPAVAKDDQVVVEAVEQGIEKIFAFLQVAVITLQVQRPLERVFDAFHA